MATVFKVGFDTERTYGQDLLSLELRARGTLLSGIA